MKKRIIRGNSLTEWDCVTILSGAKEIHPAKARAIGRRGLAEHGK
jgi:hypothetical protein